MGIKGARQYTPEFRADAVKLVSSTGRPASQVALEIGVHATTLGGWLRQAKIDAGELEGTTTDDKRRISELEKENRVLRMERDFLKKATAFCVSRMNERNRCSESNRSNNAA